jgi:hypothetical protein
MNRRFLRFLHTWPWLLGWTAFLILYTALNMAGAVHHIAAIPTRPLTEPLWATFYIAGTATMIWCLTQMAHTIARKARWQ